MPLHKVLLKNNISAESILTIEYMPAVVPPKSKQQIPHDDWFARHSALVPFHCPG